MGERKDRLEGEGWRNASVERKETRDKNGGVIMAMESSWFLVRGENLLVREVSYRFTSSHSSKRTKDRPNNFSDRLGSSKGTSWFLGTG